MNASGAVRIAAVSMIGMRPRLKTYVIGSSSQNQKNTDTVGTTVRLERKRFLFEEFPRG